MPSRGDAMIRATDYFDSGGFESDLARRVAIPSESQTAEGLPHCARYLAEEMAPAFEEMGFECRTFANPVAGAGPVLLATRIEDEALPTVLGYGHGDTVRGMEERWTRGAGPWQTAREGDRLYGRGTADNKGQHTINMAALGAVLETRGRLGFNAKFMIETGEENGSAGVHDVVRANRDAFAADAFIASDGPRVRIDRPTVSLGARGATNFDLLCHLHEGGHHSGNWGGALPDPCDGPHPRHRRHRRTEGPDQGQGMAPGADPQLGAHGARGRGARRRGGRPGGRPGLGGAGGSLRPRTSTPGTPSRCSRW